MSYVEIEIRAKSVELAVEAAMQELGVEDRDQLAVEVVNEPVKGFLGMGGQDALVRVRKKPRDRKRKRGGRGRSKGEPRGRERQDRKDRSRGEDRNKGSKKKDVKRKMGDDDRPTLGIDEQADRAREFLEGLVAAYGLEGRVETQVDDDVIIANVEGEQTEALVGVRGTVRSAVHELTRTVLQKYTQDTARLRLDIAGYGERRRQALEIYAGQLIEQLMEEGGEVMLEPMSPADRKVIHDVANERPEVTSYSEGEAPKRYVVLSKVEEGSEEE